MTKKTWKTPELHTVSAEKLAEQIHAAAWSWCMDRVFR